MRTIVVGAGAIGGVIAGYLARGGRDVIAVARGAHGAAIRERGLRVQNPDEEFVARVACVAAGEPIAWRAGDVVALAVKTQDAAAALAELGAPRDVPVACFTNGLEAERIALRYADTVVAVCVMMPGTYLEPGTVQVWASPVPGLFELGEVGALARTDSATPLACAIADELSAVGFSADVPVDVLAWKRAKLLSNLANGAEAIAGPAARSCAVTHLAEAEGHACYEAGGLSCVSEQQQRARRANFVARTINGETRAGGSTWQSFARGRKTIETDYLNGEIALLGRMYGVPTPVNCALQRLAAAAAQRGDPPGTKSLAELEAMVTKLM